VRVGGQYERTPEWGFLGIPVEAMVGGLAHSGRVVFAVGDVMVAVFLTFALSGPIRPKEISSASRCCATPCSCG
jgi:hypothetical protein